MGKLGSERKDLKEEFRPPDLNLRDEPFALGVRLTPPRRPLPRRPPPDAPRPSFGSRSTLERKKGGLSSGTPARRRAHSSARLASATSGAGGGSMRETAGR